MIVTVSPACGHAGVCMQRMRWPGALAGSSTSTRMVTSTRSPPVPAKMPLAPHSSVCPSRPTLQGATLAEPAMAEPADCDASNRSSPKQNPPSSSQISMESGTWPGVASAAVSTVRENSQFGVMSGSPSSASCEGCPRC